MAAYGRAVRNWEGLVQAALQREALRGTTGLPPRQSSGIGATTDSVPPSLLQESNVEAILLAADEVQKDDPNVSRILCEYAYSLAQNLDPNSQGRGVLQFKTGLKSVIEQKRSMRGGDRIDRRNDIALLRDFYTAYREKHRADDELRRQDPEAVDLDAPSGELERRAEKRRRVFATLRVLKEVLEALAQAEEPKAIPEELKRMMEADAAKVEEFQPYNILPLEAPGAADAIILLAEVWKPVFS